MQPEWDLTRKPENLTIDPIELEKSPEMQYRRELTMLIQESAFQNRVPLYGLLSIEKVSKQTKRHQIENILPNTKSIILMGVTIQDPMMRLWNRISGISMSTFSTIASSELEYLLLLFVNKLEDAGFMAKSVQLPFTPTSEYLWLFELSGAGFIGKNNLVITRKYGCRVNLGFIVTDAPLLNGDYRYASFKTNICGDCELCKEFCPSGALRGGTYDDNICKNFINKKENQLNFSEHSFMKCDMCMRICPIGEVGKWDKNQITWATILEERRINY